MSDKYFHEISDAELKMINSGDIKIKYGDYRQPDWCGEYNAVHPFGCWLLIGKKFSVNGLRVRSEASCKNCEMYRGER